MARTVGRRRIRSSVALVPVIGGFLAGVLSAIQARMNGELSSVFGNGVQAAMWNFGSGWIIVLALLLVMPGARAGIAQIARGLRDRTIPWWLLLGGALGALFVAAQSISVPLVGIAVFTVAYVAGQSGSSLVVDRAGLGPMGAVAVTRRRALAALIAVAGVGVAVFDRLGSGEIRGLGLIGLGLALLAGTGRAVQQALNGRVGRVASSPMSATFFNFTVGVAVLSVTLVLVVRLAAWPVGGLFTGPWWAYFGGLFGVGLVFMSSWAVAIIGVLRFGLLSIAGSLSGALLLDVFVPIAGSRVAWNLVGGVILTFVAVALSSVRPGASTRG